jgi:hypothetical protein
MTSHVLVELGMQKPMLKSHDFSSCAGTGSPPPHLFRTPYQRAYAGLRTCRRSEIFPSQYAQPAPNRLVHHKHRRLPLLPCRHRHRPPIRLGRASDGTYRAVGPSGPSASSPCRHATVAANVRSAGTNSQTGRQRRTSRISLSFSPVKHNQLSTKTPKLPNAFICRRQPSTPLAAPAGRVAKKPKTRPMGQSGGGRERRQRRVLT